MHVRKIARPQVLPGESMSTTEIFAADRSNGIFPRSHQVVLISQQSKQIRGNYESVFWIWRLNEDRATIIELWETASSAHFGH